MPKEIRIPESHEFWDEEHGRFITVNAQTLVLEHSLVSVHQWEMKWKKPFFTDEQKTAEELEDYIRCMTVNKVEDVVYNLLTPQDYKEIDEYIADPMTATTFSDLRESRSVKREVITAEIIYFNMISFGIPIELENWHINTLIALIRVFAIKNNGEKKMSRSEAAMFQRSLNERRKASHKRR